MTAEERADALEAECPKTYPHDWPCRLCLVAAIRAAEVEAADEALERAAAYVAVAGVTGTERRVFSLLAAHIRSLKSGGGSSGEGGGQLPRDWPSPQDLGSKP